MKIGDDRAFIVVDQVIIHKKLCSEEDVSYKFNQCILMRSVNMSRRTDDKHTFG
jgi:hypothetical protein